MTTDQIIIEKPLHRFLAACKPKSSRIWNGQLTVEKRKA
jgi:hypothetical protein